MKRFQERWYILDHERQPVRVSDVLDWARWFERNQLQRIVGRTDVGDAHISTVFIGLDHRHFVGDGPPLVFETVVFGGDFDGSQQRYSTWDDAEVGHAMWVKKLQATSEVKE